MDSRLCAVALEFEERLPDLGFEDADLFEWLLALAGKLSPKQVVQRLQVDEFGGVVGEQPAQAIKHVLLHVLDQFVVVPNFVEPGLQVGPVTVTVDDKVEFEVGPVVKT